MCTVCSHLPRFGRIITCRKGLINTLICYALVRMRKIKTNSAIHSSPFRTPSIVPSSKQSKVLTVINVLSLYAYMSFCCLCVCVRTRGVYYLMSIISCYIILNNIDAHAIKTMGKQKIGKL